MSHLRAVPNGRPAQRRDLRPTPAIVFLPTGLPAAAQWRDACGEYCARKGYKIAGIVRDWADLLRLVVAGEADVVVVGRRDHLSRTRTPRLEVVTEEGAELPSAQRRPRRM